MKTTIAVMSMTVVVASLFTLASPPVKTNVVEIKPKENVKSYTSQPSNTWCPVVGDGRSQIDADSLIARDENGVAIYQHCEDCRAGVISEHDDGAFKCTFCGKQVTSKN